MTIRTIATTLLSLTLSSCASMEAQYQSDADLYRIGHLIHYGELLSEYHRKTGRYPFQGISEKQLQVTFATDEQRQYLNNNSDGIVEYSANQFREEVSAALGRDVELRFDPQRVPTTMPLYYLYVVEGDKYYFVVHLYHEYSFAANRGPNFNQVEITNDNISHSGFWEFEALVRDSLFQSVASQLPDRTGWFDELEDRNN